MKKLTLLFTLFFFSLACGHEKKTLYVVFSYTPLTYIPNVKSEIVTSSILMNFYDPLIRFDADFRPSPGLAEYWENPDSLTWIFHLRKNIKFASGKILTSKDVLYTFKRISKDTSSDYRTDISSIDTIFTPDSYTVIFKLKKPCSTYLERISQILIIQDNCPDTLLANYSCGTGALIYMKTDKKGAIYAVPNTNYFGKKIAFDRIIFTSEQLPFSSDDHTFKNQYFLYTFTPPSDVSKKYNFIGIPGPLNAIRYIGVNTRIKFLNKKSFRKALYLALCRKSIADTIKKLYDFPVLPAYEVALPSQIGFVFYKAADCNLRDTIKALLGKSGYKGEPIEFLVSQTKLTYARLIKKNLEEMGINLKIDPVEPHEIFKRVKETGNFSLFLLALIPQSIDIYSTAESHFHTKDISHSLGVKNYFKYSNPVLDSLIKVTGYTVKKHEREKLLQEIESILIDDLPAIPVLYEGNTFYLSPNLHWKPRLDRLIFVNEIKPEP